MIDSQAKNTCNASIASKGFVTTKQRMGSKGIWLSIHWGFFTHCTKANVTDDQGLIEMLSHNINYFKAKPVNIPRLQFW